MAQKKVELDDHDALSAMTTEELQDLQLKVNAERDRLKEGLRLIVRILDGRATESEADSEFITPNGIDSGESVHEG